MRLWALVVLSALSQFPLLSSTIRGDQPSYSTVNQWFKDGALTLELDLTSFSTHSSWRGGASRAANVDLLNCLFKQHGRWRSERAKDGYVVSNLQARLSVLASLGLQPGVTLAELRQFEREALLA
jgi:hypothetical protein